MNKFLVSLLTLVAVAILPLKSFAMPDLTEVQNALNLSANSGPSMLLGYQLVANKVQVLKCTYDFSKQGGAVGSIIMKAVDGSQCQLPAKAIVIDGIVDVLTAPTSGGSATIAIGTGASTTDLKGATAYGSYSGRVTLIPVGTAATAVKVASKVKPEVTIATAALTAGKLNVFIQYYLSD